MAQVKIYGLKKSLNEIKYKLSETIHNTIVKELSFPKEKRYHRFMALEDEDMLFPDTKSEHYTIIEIMMMQGRSEERRKNLIKALFVNIEKVYISLKVSTHFTNMFPRCSRMEQAHEIVA